MKKLCALALTFTVLACSPAADKGRVSIPADIEEHISSINKSFIFADMHSHPSRFHRANVETIDEEEFALYRENHINVVVANISSDMAYSGGFDKRDGTSVERGQYKPLPGEAFALAFDRLQRLQKTFELNYAIPAFAPGDALTARRNGQVTVIPALEGGDALEGDIENLREMHRNGLRLLQIVHFRANEIGHIQTYPYSPGGLTAFGREAIGESNRLGIVIDLAHANTETIMDVLSISSKPVIFSHGGVKALLDQDRAVSDDEIRAIAAGGGVIGIWPHGKYVETVARMVDFIEHVIDVAGPDHAGIGSDLRGTSSLSKGFGKEANFRAIAMEMLNRGHSDETVGKVMGGNFFRVWQTVSETG